MPREVDGAVAMAVLSPDGAWEPVPVTVQVSWTSADPWQVALRFGPGAGATCWSVALELLAAGCDAPAGLGDVSLLPDPATEGEHGCEVAELVLSSPKGKACLRVEVASLEDVLDEITLGGATDLDAGGRELVAAAALSGWLDGLADPRRRDGRPLGSGGEYR